MASYLKLILEIEFIKIRVVVRCGFLPPLMEEMHYTIIMFYETIAKLVVFELIS